MIVWLDIRLIEQKKKMVSWRCHLITMNLEIEQKIGWKKRKSIGEPKSGSDKVIKKNTIHFLYGFAKKQQKTPDSD